MRLVNVADKQFIQTKGKNQHYRRQQITVHYLDDMRHRAVMQRLARFVGQAGIGIMQRVLE